MSYPDPSQVINGVVYGASNELTGIYTEPDQNSYADFGLPYGPDGQTVGTLPRQVILESAGGNYVAPDRTAYAATGNSYGPNGSIEGTLLPKYIAAATGFGLLGAEDILNLRTGADAGGVYVPPSASQVQLNVAFGVEGSETGTYDPAPAAVAAQLATDVAAVDANKTFILRPESGGPDAILGVVGTLVGMTPTNGKTRCALVCYDAAGDPDKDASVQIQMTGGGNLGAWTSAIIVCKTDHTGNILDPVDGLPGVSLATGLPYRAKRGLGAGTASDWVSFVPNGETDTIPALYGSDA